MSVTYRTEITVGQYYPNKGGEGFIAIVQASQTVTVTSSNILTDREYEVINTLAGMKEKTSEKVQCAWCKVTETPQWREGPAGTTLCNACGLRFTKRLEKYPDLPLDEIITLAQVLRPGGRRGI